jgi:hypothetical protein
MRTLFTVSFLSLAFFCGSLRAEVYEEERSGIEFPEAISGFSRMEVKPYEYEPGKQGVAIGYGNQGTAITVYVRATPKDLSHLTSADFVQEAIGQVKVLEEKGYLDKVRFFEFAADKERPGWKTEAFNANFKGDPIESFISCKAAPGYMVKIRATTPQVGDEKLQAVIASLKETVNKAP